MESTTLAQLLRLPAGDRADLAMALWESLSDDEREGELALTAEQRAEHPRQDGVNGQPEELLVLAEASGLPRGDTSRMSCEAHVRICEQPGVQFPGLTRPRREIPRGYSASRARSQVE